MNANDERTTKRVGMHEGVETWDTECGCGVPHWWGPMGPESWDEHPRDEIEAR